MKVTHTKGVIGERQETTQPKWVSLLLDLMFKAISFLIVPTCKGLALPPPPAQSWKSWAQELSQNILRTEKDSWAYGFSDLMVTSKERKYPLEGDNG